MRRPKRSFLQSHIVHSVTSGLNVVVVVGFLQSHMTQSVTWLNYCTPNDFQSFRHES
jgi:hypothetical protein